MDFIRFSDKAKKYLDKLVRDSSFVFLDRKMVSDYLNNHKIPPFEKIIDFQVDFSGLKLKITSKPNSSFNSYLFSRVDILENRRIDFIEIEDTYYFDCGEHATAPFWFVIGSDGQICTYNNDDYTVNVIFDSFEKLIETFAFEDLLLKSGMYEYPYFHNIENVNCINYFKENFSFHIVESDRYNQWFSNENITFRLGTWLDNPSFYIQIFSKGEKLGNTFMQSLIERKIIS